MKKLITILLLFLTPSLFATNYYISASGNDANNGTSTSTPWKTTDKVNSIFSSLLPGDRVYFKKGDTFYGSMYINKSGSDGKSIVISSYGTGANPVITGLTNITAWTNISPNIWESTTAVSSLSTLNMVVINGVNTPMGRWPNANYVPFQSFSGSTSITSSSLNSSTINWTGAEAVIRTSQFTWERTTISSASGSTINFGAVHYPMTNNFKFFIENDPRLLDVQNEWYYNPSTKKIRIYSTSTPTGVQVATINDLIDLAADYVTITGIDLYGSNNYGVFDSDLHPYDSIYNCNINFSGINGIQLVGHNNVYVGNSTVNNSQVNGISLDANDDHASVINNAVTNAGLFEGMGLRNITYNNESLTGILSDNLGATISGNTVKNVGYVGISFNNDSVLVQNNTIDTFCVKTQDGGGIYTFTNVGTTNYFRRVIGNIISHGIAEPTGTDSFYSVSTYHTPPLLNYKIAEGIYLDDSTANVEVANNTIFGCNGDGIFEHMAINCYVHDNLAYDNTIQLSTRGYQRNTRTIGNKLVARTSDQICAYYEYNPISGLSFLDSNYYARPIDDNLTIYYSLGEESPMNIYSLASWQSASGMDLNSHTSAITVTDVSQLLFLYNPNPYDNTVSVTGSSIDVTGTTYTGDVTLQPYSSTVIVIPTDAGPIILTINHNNSPH